MYVIKSLLMVSLIGLVAAQEISEQSIEEIPTELIKSCLNRLLNNFSHVLIPDVAAKLLGILETVYPNTAFIHLGNPNEEATRQIKKLGYPEGCDNFLKEFKLIKPEDTQTTECLEQIKFFDLNQRTRDLIAENKKLDKLLGAAYVCYDAIDLWREQEASAVVE